jgi:hypothetical protein
VGALVEAAAGAGDDPAATFYRVRALSAARGGRGEGHPAPGGTRLPPPERPIPARLTEPWFC